MRDWIIRLLLSALVVFAPIKATLIVVIVLTLGDLVSGLIAAHHRKEEITSKGLRRTLVKIMVYEAVVMLGYLTEQYMTGDLVPIVKVLAGMIGIAELKSILENLEEITGVPVLKLLINKLSQTSNIDQPK